MSIFVTTPIFYPNEPPHIGTAYPVLAADIIKRWAKLCGREAFMLTGTDEHGKKIERAAQRRGLEPREFVDQLAAEFKKTFSALHVEFDRFIRTTDADHVEVVQFVLRTVREHGDIYQGSYSGHYCVECEAYYAADDLKNGSCPLHGKPVEWLEEDCYYFRLSKYQDWLLDLYDSRPDFIQPESRRNEVIRFVRDGLDDLCISRSTFKWGIPLPFAEGHITYVWFDALLNYVTGAGLLTDPDQFRDRWRRVVHLVGKDILRFHAVIWPAMLRSAGIDPPRHVFAHGFWTVNGRKFSKSLGNVIQPDYLIEKYGVDTLRYYLFREFAFGADGDFSESNLVQRNNSELAQGLGNLVRRVTVLIEKQCSGIVPASTIAEGPEESLQSLTRDVVGRVDDSMKRYDLKGALEATWQLVGRLNAYLNEREPWHLNGTEHAAIKTSVLAHLAEGLRFLSVLTAPFMPSTALSIARSIGLESIPAFDSLIWGDTLSGRSVHVGQPLFPMLAPPAAQSVPLVTYSCAPEVAELGIACCVAQIDNVKIRKQASELERRKRSVEKRVRKLGNNWLHHIPEARGYHELYALIGKKTGEISSPLDLLSDYIFDSPHGHLPQINTVVDLYNLYSLETFLSIGAHDRDKLKGAIRLEIAENAVPYLPLGSTVPVDVEPGEYFWRDDENVLCRLDIKQGEATKIDAHTRHIVLIVQGNPAITAAALRQATEKLCEEITLLCGGTFRILEPSLYSLSREDSPSRTT